ncbi:helix-turn-helix domain-containing protein [Photorhabdus asymbiotica]|uniref:helix-turn-helix domain-containing protein n=1 Tax=Photorhabdus asymbiotica TaxID=291112 RepID=UPI003DA6D919
MKNLADRLKFVLYKLDISQAEAAKRCRLAQQSLNYIIRNNLDESKLSNRIAEGLNLNPEWLISGKGNFRNPEIYRVPLIDNYFSLGLYIRGQELGEDTQYLLTTRFLGNRPFAKQTEKNKIAVCCSKEFEIESVFFNEYLYITEDYCKVVESKDLYDQRNVYTICEWRVYNVDFSQSN